MNRCLQETDIPQWMTQRKASLIKKKKKETAPNNYRPITGLLMMWNILMEQIRKETYYLLISHGLFPVSSSKLKEARGTGELLYISMYSSSQGEETRWKNVSITWLTPERHTRSCLKMYEISGEVIKFIENTMENWKVELTAGEKSSISIETGGNKRTSSRYPNYSIVEISQNSEKSPRLLRRLAVTQTPVENHQINAGEKNSRKSKIRT